MSRLLRKQYGCPVELAVDVLGGKWKTVILARIKEGPLSYGSLREAIPGLSDKVLSQKLRELTDLGLIEHEADASARIGGSTALPTEGGNSHLLWRPSTAPAGCWGALLRSASPKSIRTETLR